ncbi:uncharacterized protein BDV17DRAFT_163351 [Aspergillus undulatus]|uniref:uncharacterized protein n=1 Tax=Aspergillus undulatus TaxID=1810928 RepID=UPI003CCC98E6
MTPPKIFLTGASGYIAGDVLHALLTTHPTWENRITLLLRPGKESYIPRFKSVYPTINTFIAELDDVGAIANEVAKHGIVLHFALSADHLLSARAIVAGLSRRGGGVYIHTSGTDVLLDPGERVYESAEGVRVRVFDDWEGIGSLRSLPDAAAHREVDKYVLSSSSSSSTLKTAIVCPSTVYGIGRGLISQRSHQIPNLTRLILQEAKGLQLSDGETFWNSVHVYDLSRLYVRLIEGAIAEVDAGSTSSSRGSITWNEEGYYLVESGIYHWGDIARRITAEAYRLSLVPSGEVRIVGMEDRDVFKTAGRPVVNYSVAAKAIRARKLLDWSPVEGSLEDGIPDIVKAEARALGLLQS